jgi:hypothetical protein
MTVPIEEARIRTDSILGGISRYSEQTVIYWSDRRLLTFDTYLRKPLKKTGKERVMLVTKGVEYRPDLVAYDVYGAPDAWWIILEFNGIKDIFDFQAGLTIMLPDNVFR